MQTLRRVLLGLVLMCLLVPAVSSEEYIIGPEDVLEIRFYKDASLNSQVRVSQSGTIVVDLIGQVQAAGKTTKELQTEIYRQVSRLTKDVSQTVVRVIAYNSRYVFVTGQVMAPSKLSFENIPDLWTVLSEAGGPSEFADLSRVTIIRGGDRAGEIETVDVASALATATLQNLPSLHPGDAIEVPRNPVGLPKSELASGIDEKNVYYVTGAVLQPGPQKFEKEIDILEAIAIAGGPAENADLKHVQLVTNDGNFAQTMEFNLERFLKTGTPVRYTLRKEDALYIPSKGQGIFDNALVTIASVAGVVTSVLLIWDRVDNDNNR